MGSFIAMIAANMTETTTDGIRKPRADIKTLEPSIIRYKHLTHTMPDSLRDLAFRPLNWSGPWRKMIEESALIDPWGQPYQYRNPGHHNPNGYDIFSKGPDMKEDTEDDIGNWQN